MLRITVACAFLGLVFAGCGGDEAPSNDGPATGAQSTTSTSSTVTTVGGGTTTTSGTVAGNGSDTTSSTATTGGDGTTATSATTGTTTGTTTTTTTATATTTTTTTDGGGGATSTTSTTGSSGGMEWLPSWATSIQLTEERNAPSESLANKTLRQFVFPTYSGSQIRIQLSNEKGTGPVEISKVHIAKAEPLGNGQIDASTDVEFTFGGSASVTISQGETVWSDPVEFDLQEMQPTAVTMLLGATVPGSNGITGHPGARTNSYVANNDVVSEANISGSKYERWYFINAIEVMAPAEAFAIVALGDSITDGYGIHDEFKRWPDFLTAAINADPDLKDLVSVIDAGNGGNALLNGDGYMDAGVDRVARDILARPKVKHVIVLFGVNDILYGTLPAGGAQGMADNIVAGYREIVDACRAAGIKVYGSPITPFGANNADAQLNSARTIVNTAVLAGDIFDEVIDFSAVLVQPGSNPEAIQASMNNDGLHPSAAGYEAMANAVDLALFK